MDWPYYPQTSRQNYKTSFNLESMCENEKKTPKILVTPGDSWRNWLRTGVPDIVMFGAYAPEGATKGLVD